MVQTLIQTYPEKDVWGHKTGQIIARLDTETAYAATKAEAVDALMAALLAAAQHTQTRYVWCLDGELLAVRYAYGSWGYDIVRRDSASGVCPSCWGMRSLDEALASASTHADQSYGGMIPQEVRT